MKYSKLALSIMLSSSLSSTIVFGKSKKETLYFTAFENNVAMNSDQLDFGQQIYNKQIESGLSPVVIENTLHIDRSARKHKIVGFGASVTESCITNLNKMSENKREALFADFFSEKKGARFNFLRIPLGSNDFANKDYSFNDIPEGETDPEFKKLDFSPLKDQLDFIKKAKKINPKIQFMASTWSPPAWMKDSNKLRGGQVSPHHYDSFAEYLSVSIKHLAKNNINVGFLSVINEPLIGWAKVQWNFPQTFMSIDDQYNFTRDSLIPSFEKNKIKTKVLIHDHNWDNSDGAIEKFKHLFEEKNPHMGGVAFHCYGGDHGTELNLLQKYKGIPFFNTECSGVLRDGDLGQSFQWWMNSQSVDAVQEGTSGALAWNMCLDEGGGPTNNGCRGCRGMVTINSKTQDVTYNSEYYAFKQVSRFVYENAQVVENSFTEESELRALTAVNTDGSLVVVIRNQSGNFAHVKVEGFKNTYLLPPRSALTIKKN